MASEENERCGAMLDYTEEPEACWYVCNLPKGHGGDLHRQHDEVTGKEIANWEVD
jgi:hypothetical protein